MRQPASFVHIYPEAFSRWEKLEKYVPGTQMLIVGSGTFAEEVKLKSSGKHADQSSKQ